jgi:hypothetical protein
LWSYRARLPEPLRLPAPRPWGAEDTHQLLGGNPRPRENRTPRIVTDTMELLLMWSLRFVETFADDIVAAFHEHLALFPYGPAIRGPAIRRARRSIDEVLPDLHAYLNRLRTAAEAIPGRLGHDGTPEIDWAHLTRLLRSSESAFTRSARLRQPVERSGLPIAPTAYLDSPITGLLDGRPWRSARIANIEAPKMAQLLHTACFIVITYLSGMRTGEVLNLERNCLAHDDITGIWSITGRQFKGASDHRGDKIPKADYGRTPGLSSARPHAQCRCWNACMTNGCCSRARFTPTCSIAGASGWDKAAPPRP